MTRQRDFKKLVRERISRTGERYTTARSHLLAKLKSALRDEYPGVFDGYDRFGGLQGDTSVLTNMLRYAGIRKPDGSEYSEVLVNGLCGGIGFLYAVFEYKGYPPMLTIVARSSSMPDTYLAEGLARCGGKVSTRETGGAATAKKQLEATLQAETPAICTVDVATLPYMGMPKEWGGMSPHIVGVVGRDGDDVWLDDRAVAPIRISSSQLAAARASYKKGKHRLTTIEGALPEFDLAVAVKSAVALTVKNFHESPFKGFASNFGFNGMEKWHRLLTDTRDAKGWPRVFASGGEACTGLHRVYECIQMEYTAPDAGRPLYAQFLHEAAAITGEGRFAGVAGKFDESGRMWHELTEVVLSCGDKAVLRRCEFSDRRAELIDTKGAEPSEELTRMWKERLQLAKDCKLNEDDCRELYAMMAEVLGRIIPLERDAIEQLRVLTSN